MSALHYRTFLPPNIATRGAVPLLVALHGCNQTANDFAIGTRFDDVAARYGAIVVYPEPTTAANKMGCWNWFLREHQSRTSGEPAAILDIVNEVKRRNSIDPNRVFVAGISAGGAMAAILGEQAPDVFSGVGIMAGVALHSAHDLPSAFSAMSGKGSRAPGAMSAAMPAAAGMVALKGMRSPKLHSLVEKLSVGLGPVLQRSTRERTFGKVAPPEALQHVPPSSYARTRVMVWCGTNDTTVVPENAETLASQYATLLGLEQEPSQRDGNGGIEIERWRDDRGRSRIELWTVENMGHAWSGGDAAGSFTYPSGPDASTAMFAFFCGAAR
jgi:poly(hydroxyalkanoate) depolymerase family esterase